MVAGLLILAIGISCVPVVSAADVSSIPFVEWSYHNSIAVTAVTPDSYAFTPADFAGTDCKKVFILNKSPVAQGVCYTMVLWLNVETESALLSAMDTIQKLPFVINAQRTGFKEYVQCPSVLTLNHETVTISVGETADVYIETADLYSTEHLVNMGIEFEVDSSTFDIQDSRWDWLSQRNPQPIDNGGKNIRYRFKTDNTDDVFGMTAKLAVYSEFLSINILTDATVSGNPFYEYWSIADSRIAGITLSGGEEETTAQTLLNQTAHIRGIRPGTTTLILNRGGFGADATAVCNIIVIGNSEMGDVNEDGQVTAADALLTLQHATQKTALENQSVTLADFDGDGSITAVDALQILQIAVGKATF